MPSRRPAGRVLTKQGGVRSNRNDRPTMFLMLVMSSAGQWRLIQRSRRVGDVLCRLVTAGAAWFVRPTFDHPPVALDMCRYVRVCVAFVLASGDDQFEIS
jgi:hypothetical protein